MVQHKRIWTLSTQFIPAITKDWDFAITLKPKIYNLNICNYLYLFKEM